MNSVHEMHDRKWFMETYRHFVFAFHDSTFECVAAGFDAELRREVNLLELLAEDPV